MTHDIQALASAFRVTGDFVSAVQHVQGHINDTYISRRTAEGGGTVGYVHQRINDQIFKDPVALMENVHRVTTHQRHKLREAGVADAGRRALTLVPSVDGLPYHRDESGGVWRTYTFIESASTYEFVDAPRQAFEAAKAFGEFQRQLVDLPGGRLHETIPDFHHTPRRFEALERAVELDSVGRVRLAQREVDFALSRKRMTTVLVEAQAAGVIPERITHNDTKLNNVMLDDETQEGVCVIDLDTVMPGVVLNDFGDMVRTATSPSAEDEMDLSKVTMQMPMFEALVEGYLSSAGEFLESAEREHLAFSGKLITFEIGIRFLADFLAGDVYFKVHRDGHNLDRCRTQFKLVESIEQQEDAMNRFVASS